MKRIIVIIFTFLMLLATFGCSTTMNGPVKGENEVDVNLTYEFYIDKVTDARYPRLVKYNIHTGITSPVCTDAVCEHDDSCFFSMVTMIAAEGDTVYFARDLRHDRKGEGDEVGNVQMICSYSYSTGEAKVLYNEWNSTHNAIQRRLTILDGYVYFYKRYPLDTPEETAERPSEFTLCRVPCNGGEYEVVGKIGSANSSEANYKNNILFYDGIDSVYYFDNETQEKKTLMTLTEQGAFTASPSPWTNKIIYWLSNNTSKRVFFYYPETNKHELIYETDKSISSIRVYNEQIYLLIDSVIYKLDPETKECEVFFEKPGLKFTLYSIKGNYLVIKKNIGPSYEFYTYNIDEIK